MKTNIKNLGVEFPFQSKEILKKCHATSVKVHGKNYKKIRTSRQQRILNSIYGGVLNYSECPYYLDIFFEEEKIYLEYDGSGHKLSIKLGTKSIDQFECNEKKRREFLKEKGYKEFRILSSDDLLPNKKELLEIKNKAFRKLLNEGYNTYIYNLDIKTESFSM